MNERSLVFSGQNFALHLRDIFAVRWAPFPAPTNSTAVWSPATGTSSVRPPPPPAPPRAMLWQGSRQSGPHPALLPHQARLLARRIRRFDESNWWQWGRAWRPTPPHLNSKTRRADPLFSTLPLFRRRRPGFF